MLSLLKIEWIKLKNYRTFWLITILTAVGFFALNFTVYNLVNSADNEAQLLYNAPFNFPNIWQTVSYLSGYLLFLPGLLIITLLTNEFTFRTHRQNILDGVSRSQFIHVKLISILLLSFIFTLIVFACGLLLGFLSGGPFRSIDIQYICFFFLQILSYCGIAFMFGLFIKRSGLAIGLYFIYIWIIEEMVSNMINMSGFYLGNYFPLSAADKLIPLPLKILPPELTAGVHVPALLFTTIAYYFVFYLLAIRKFKSEDL